MAGIQQLTTSSRQPVAHLPDRIPARSERDARDRFLTFLSRTLQCLSSTTHWIVGPPQGRYSHLLADNVLVALLPNAPLAVPRNNGDILYFAPTITFRVVADDRVKRREFRTTTLGYIHVLAIDEQLTHPLFEWHWHDYLGPENHHVHVSAHGELGDLTSYHVPTGRTHVEGIVRFMIEELDVVPAHKGWDKVISDSETRFQRHRRR